MREPSRVDGRVSSPPEQSTIFHTVKVLVRICMRIVRTSSVARCCRVSGGCAKATTSRTHPAVGESTASTCHVTSRHGSYFVSPRRHEHRDGHGYGRVRPFVRSFVRFPFTGIIFYFYLLFVSCPPPPHPRGVSKSKSRRGALRLGSCCKHRDPPLYRTQIGDVFHEGPLVKR